MKNNELGNTWLSVCLGLMISVWLSFWMADISVSIRMRAQRMLKSRFEQIKTAEVLALLDHLIIRQGIGISKPAYLNQHQHIEIPPQAYFDLSPKRPIQRIASKHHHAAKKVTDPPGVGQRLPDSDILAVWHVLTPCQATVQAQWAVIEQAQTLWLAEGEHSNKGLWCGIQLSLLYIGQARDGPALYEVTPQGQRIPWVKGVSQWQLKNQGYKIQVNFTVGGKKNLITVPICQGC